MNEEISLTLTSYVFNIHIYLAFLMSNVHSFKNMYATLVET
jgi:hypothetical protein